MNNQKKIYTKQEIEKYLTSQKNFDCRIYAKYGDLTKQENYVDYGQSLDDIYEYTDGLFFPQNSVCYYIEGHIFPDNKYGSTEIFINYNKKNQPIGVFVNDAWANLGEKFSEMTKHLASIDEN